MASEESIKWADGQAESMDRGQEIVKNASNEAIEYMAMLLENIEDKAWRRMAVNQHALFMGVGIGVAENIVHNIYDTMEDTFTKKAGMSEQQAEILRSIYIGRAMKNIMEELNRESQ